MNNRILPKMTEEEMAKVRAYESERELIWDQVRDWNPFFEIDQDQIERLWPSEAWPHIWEQILRSYDNYRARKKALSDIHDREFARHAAQERIRQLNALELGLVANLHRAFSLLLPAEDAATEALAEARRRGVSI